jgi:hypothetical protein
MRRPRSLLIALALAALLAGAFPALLIAASPKKGGTYAGELSETAGRISKRVVLKVSSTGATGRARLQCADTRIGLSSKFTISKGKFTAKKAIGSSLVWRLKGKFTSKETAKAKLYLPAVCDGKGGKITLELE